MKPPPWASPTTPQDALGDVVFVDLPEIGRTFQKKGDGWRRGRVGEGRRRPHMPSAARSSRSTRLSRRPFARQLRPAGRLVLQGAHLQSRCMAEFDQLMDTPAYEKAAEKRLTRSA